MTERRDGCPPSVYYDYLRLPGPSEEREWTALPMYPEEAHSVLVNTLADGEKISPATARALDRIIWGDCEQDFLAVLAEEREMDQVADEIEI